ncbi:MAG: hypothetical protein R3B13_33315 [Polyangiaceae bacterium]
MQGWWRGRSQFESGAGTACGHSAGGCGGGDVLDVTAAGAALVVAGAEGIAITAEGVAGGGGAESCGR